MWPNLQFPADLVIFTEKSLMENFIFCAVIPTRKPLMLVLQVQRKQS